MTIKEAVECGTEELKRAHTHDPDGCAKFFLRHVLDKNPDLATLTDPTRRLTNEQEKKYRDMLLRRRLHEPVWYITKEAYFWKDAFFVDERVLIPRPETEILVEKVLDWVQAQSGNSERGTAKKTFTDHRSRFTVIDVGTGSGEIAISLAREMREMSEIRDSRKRQSRQTWPSDRAMFTIYASDISPDAIEVAKFNAKRIGVERFITFLVGDALDPFTEKVDIIVGNPPYVPTEVVGGLAYDIHHFEPRVALDGGADGLDVHRKILKKARKLIRSGGAIFLEIGHDQGKLAQKIASEHFPAAETEIIKDYDKNDRVLSVKT